MMTYGTLETFEAVFANDGTFSKLVGNWEKQVTNEDYGEMAHIIKFMIQCLFVFLKINSISCKEDDRGRNRHIDKATKSELCHKLKA